MHLRTFTISSVAMVTLLGLSPAASADDLRTQSGPGASSDGSFITYVGCDSFGAVAAPPQTRLNLGPATAPIGKRSLGLVPSGAGTASGPFVRFSSLADMDAAVSVSSGSGTTGVSYLWVITPDVQPGTAWSGRASLAVTAGGWQQVASRDLAYHWSLVDLSRLQPVQDAGQATPEAFAAAHGDGAGYVVTGFGCDGHDFNIDAVRGGGTTLDFEGVALTTTIEVPSREAGEDGAIHVAGASRDSSGRLTGDPLVLETRAQGGAWSPVEQPRLADADGVTRAQLVVTEPTEVRWHRPESQYADEGWSDVVLVQPEQAGGGGEGQ